MGASKFSGLFNKNPDYFDGEAKESRSTDSILQPALYKLLAEAAVQRASFDKQAADGAAATATTEQAFWLGDGTYIKSVRAVKYVPNAALTADSTNFATLNVRIRKADGTLSGIIAQATTKLTGAGGTGNWLQNTPVIIPLFDGTIAVPIDNAKLDIPKDGQLTFEILKAAAGVVVPAGLLQVILL